jgi:hypothetical protein
MFSLLIFFDHLADAGIQPFSQRDERFEKPCVTPCLDWSGLPDTLNFIVEIAKEYGGFQSDRLIRRLLPKLSERERKDIRCAVIELNRSDTRLILDEWCLRRDGAQYWTGQWGLAALYFLNWIEDRI